MNKTALITTLIPTYRRPHLLQKAIESALNQTITESLVYVFDNASGDETRFVVEEFCKMTPRVRYFCHPENVGLVRNFAAALEKVETPYFSFLQDDDSLLPWFYETALKGFEKHPEAGFSVCRTLYVDAKGKPCPSQFSQKPASGFYPCPESLLALFKTHSGPWNGTLFKSSMLEKTGGIDLEAGLALDAAFMIKCAAHFPFVASTKPAALFVVWPGSVSYSQLDSFSDLTPLLNLLKVHLNAPQQIHAECISHLRQLQISIKWRIWIRSLLTGKIEEARSAKIDFLCMGGRVRQSLLRVLIWCETSRILRSLLHVAHFLRNKKYVLQALLSARHDPERKLYSTPGIRVLKQKTGYAGSLKRQDNQDR